MVILSSGCYTNPESGTVAKCKTTRVKLIGWAIAQNRNRDRAKSEAAREADKQVKDNKATTHFRCPACECKDNMSCVNGGNEWTGFEGYRYERQANAANGDEVWKSYSTKTGWQYCSCRSFTNISYRPSLKREFVAAKRAIIRLEKANLERGAKSRRRSRTRSSRR